MIALFKSRKAAMVLIGLGILTALSIVKGFDVTAEIVTLIGLYITEELFITLTELSEPLITLTSSAAS